MADDPRAMATRGLQALYNLGTLGHLSDGQLLERFANREGEVAELAFAVLVEKHGPMVLRVCRSVLKDDHAAQDAFQATFLVLVHKARGLWVRDSIGPWLHQVALRVASRSRLDAARRRQAEGQAAGFAPRFQADPAPDDLGEVLHREIDALPDRYRSAVVLCCLEGLSLDQAASRLGWPMGTVQSRLARGRQRLRDRLAQKGLSPSVSTAGMALAAERAGAILATSLAGSTTRAAMRIAAGQALAGVVPASVGVLVQEVLRTMTFPIGKTALAALLAIGGITAGAASLTTAQQEAGKPSAPPSSAEASPPNTAGTTTPQQQTGKPSASPSSAEASPPNKLRSADTDRTIGIPPLREGQQIEVLTMGPGTDWQRTHIMLFGGKYYVQEQATSVRGRSHNKFDGTYEQMSNRYSLRLDRKFPIELPGPNQSLEIRMLDTDHGRVQFTIKLQADGTYLAHGESYQGSGDLKRKERDILAQILKRPDANPRPSGPASPTPTAPPSAPSTTATPARPAPFEFEYLPLAPEQNAPGDRPGAFDLESKVREGWEYCGCLDIRLTKDEYEALRDGKPLSAAGDQPQAKYKVLVFKRPRKPA